MSILLELAGACHILNSVANQNGYLAVCGDKSQFLGSNVVEDTDPQIKEAMQELGIAHCLLYAELTGRLLTWKEVCEMHITELSTSVFLSKNSIMPCIISKSTIHGLEYMQNGQDRRWHPLTEDMGPFQVVAVAPSYIAPSIGV